MLLFPSWGRKEAQLEVEARRESMNVRVTHILLKPPH